MPPYLTDADMHSAALKEVSARDRRNAELEEALRPFADAVYNDNGDVTISTSHIEVGDYLRAKRLLSQ